MIVLGLTPAALLEAVNPRLIVCSISGLRAGRSPWRDATRLRFRDSGTQRPDEHYRPRLDGFRRARSGVAITDVVAGLYAAVAVLACLHARQIAPATATRSTWPCWIAPWRARSTSPRRSLFERHQASAARKATPTLQIVPYQLFSPLAMAGSCWPWATTASGVKRFYGGRQPVRTWPPTKPILLANADRVQQPAGNLFR